MAKHKENNNSETNESKEKKRRLKPWQVVVLTIIPVLVAGVLLYTFLPGNIESESRDTASDANSVIRNTVSGKGTIVTKDNLDEVRNRFDEKSPDAQYTVSMTTNWMFETALTPSTNAVVDNVEYNSRTVCFDVTLNDTGRLVYSSPYIPLGETLQDFALDENLNAGVYSATITFYLVDDDYNVVAEVSDSVTLTIKA